MYEQAMALKMSTKLIGVIWRKVNKEDFRLGYSGANQSCSECRN